MHVVGLTGSIGMGKSTVAQHLRAQGISVFDADGEVHRLYAGPAVPAIERRFPGTTTAAGVDRKKLSDALKADASGFRDLEAIVHPLVRKAERAFLREAHHQGAQVAVLEIPLLLEGGSERLCDAVIVASAAPDVQRSRVMARPGMTADLFEKLLKRQMPDAEKRKRAHFVVDTNGSVADTLTQTDAIVKQIKDRPATAFKQHWA